VVDSPLRSSLGSGIRGQPPRPSLEEDPTGTIEHENTADEEEDELAGGLR
jgi:hypothetical protein